MNQEDTRCVKYTNHKILCGVRHRPGLHARVPSGGKNGSHFDEKVNFANFSDACLRVRHVVRFRLN